MSLFISYFEAVSCKKEKPEDKVAEQEAALKAGAEGKLSPKEKATKKKEELAKKKQAKE